MPVILHTPKQADTLTTGATRQIESLIAVTSQLLDSGNLSWTQDCRSELQIQHEDSECSDVVIRIDIRAFARTKGSTAAQLPTQHHPRSLIVSPRFPGALLTHDIEITGDPKQSNDTDMNRYTMSEADHYGSFAPLPQTLNRTAALMNKKGKTGLELIFLLALASETSDSYDEDITTLVSAIRKLAGISTITIMIGPNLQGGTVTNINEYAIHLTELSEEIQRTTGLPTTLLDYHNIDESLLPSLIAKFDVAFCAGCAYYADVVQLGVPVYAWRLNTSSAELNDWIESNLSIRLRDEKDTINQRQRDWLYENRFSENHVTIDNNMLHYERVIHRFLTEHLHTGSKSTDNADQLTVIGPTTTCYPGSQKNQTRHTLGKVRRKLIKFRQSPTRFIRDSDNALAKKLHMFLRDPAV